MEELIIDLYNKYAPGQLSQDKINYIKSNYGNDLESFVKDFYGKYAPSEDVNQKWFYIQENYLKKKDEAFPLSSGQEGISSDIRYMGTDGQLAPSPISIGVPRIDERGYTASGEIYAAPVVPPAQIREQVAQESGAAELGTVGAVLKPYLPKNFESLTKDQQTIAMQEAASKYQAKESTLLQESTFGVEEGGPGAGDVIMGSTKEMYSKLMQSPQAVAAYFLSDEDKQKVSELEDPEARWAMTKGLLMADEDIPMAIKTLMPSSWSYQALGKEGAEQQAEVMDQYDRGVTQYIVDGEYGNAGKLAFYQAMASLPTMAAAMVPGGQVALGLSSFADFTIGDIERGETLDLSDLMNNITKAGAEAFWERYTGKLGNRALGQFIGKRGASDAAAKSITAEILKGFGLGVAEEGGSEAATAVSQLLSDAIFAGREVPMVEAMKQISDAFLVGGLMGGPLSGAGAGYEAAKKKVANEIASKSDKETLQKNTEKKAELTKARAEAQDPAVVNTIDELIEAIDNNSADIEAKLKGTVDNMTDEEIAEVTMLRREAEQLAIKAQQLKDDPNLDESSKSTALEVLKQQASTAIQKRQTIINNAVQKQATSKVPVQPEARVGEEVAQGAPEAKPEVVTEEGIQEEEVTKVSDALSEMGGVYYMDGQKGEVKTIGQTVVFETADRIFDIGNIDEVSDSTIESFGINKESELDITLNDDNSVTVNGTKYLNRYSDPNAAISVDKDGNYSVNLETEGGQKRTFRGQRADQIVYQTTLKNFENNATTEQTESAIQYADEAIGAQEQAREAAPKREGKSVGTITQRPVESKVEKYEDLSQPVKGQKAKKPSIITASDTKVVDEAYQNAKDPNVKKVYEDILRSFKVLKTLVPDLEIRLHEKNADYVLSGNPAGSAGNMQGNVMSINLEAAIAAQAQADITKHEAIHPIMQAIFDKNPEIANRLYSELETFSDPNFKIAADHALEFAEQYRKYGEEVVKMEAIVEFCAMVATKYDAVQKANPTTLEKLKNFFNNVAQLFGIQKKVSTDKDILTLARTISYAFLKEEDASNLLDIKAEPVVLEDMVEAKKKPTKRELLSTEYLREKLSSIVSKYNEVGAIQPRQKELVDVAAALKDQLRAQAKSAREAIKFVNTVRKNITEAVSQMEKSGTIPASKARAIINKMGKVNLTKEVAVDNLINYLEKVFSNAKHIEQLSESKSIRKKIKKLAKSDKLQAEQAAIAKKFSKIDPNLVSDLDEYLKMANAVQNAIKPSKIKVVEGVPVIDMKQAMEFNDMYEYISKTLSEQEKTMADGLREIHKDLVDAGVITEDMSLEEIEYLINALKEGTIESDLVEDKKIVRDFIRKAFDSYAALMRESARTDIDPMTGESLELSDDDRKLAMQFSAIDTDKLSVREAVAALDAMNNFLVNHTTDGMGSVVKSYEGALNADRGAKIMNAKPIRYAGNKKLGRFMFRYFGQIQLVFEAAFKDPVAWSQISLDSGFREFTLGKTKAHIYTKKVIDEYNEKFKSIKDFHTPENTFERYIYAIMYRTVSDTEIGRKKEFDRQKRIIEESVFGRIDYGTDEQQKYAEMEREVYNRILKDANNIEDVAKNVSSDNKAAVQFWIDQFSKKFDDFQKVSRAIHNVILSEDINYTPQRHSVIGGKQIKESEDLTFIQNGQFFYDKKAGSFMERNTSLTTLPKNQDRTPSRGINLEFDTTMFNAFLEAMVDSETAASVKKMEGYFNSPGFAKMVKSNEDRDMLRKIITEFISESKKGNYVPATEFREITKWLDDVSAFGTARALASVSQPILQTVPVMLNTLVNAGRLDIGAWSEAQDWLRDNGYEIAVRGLTSRADVQSIKSLIKMQEEGKTRQFIRGLRKFNEKALEKGLGSFDKWIAEVSWISYYKQNLKKRGLDIDNIDWSSHTPDPIAAEYAQSMVNRNQNISDIDQIGKVFKDKNEAITFIRKTAFAFASFSMNQKMRMAVDAKVLRNRDGNYTDEQKARAIRSLAATGLEMAAFRGIQIGIATGLYIVGKEILKSLIGDDEEELNELIPGAGDIKSEQDFAKFINSQIGYATATSVYDVMSPIPATDPAIASAWNLIADVAGLSDDVMLPEPKSGTLRQLGTYGVAGEKLYKMIEMINLASTGQFEYDGRFGKQTMYINGEEMDAEATAATIYSMYALGLIPETLLGKIAENMHRIIKDRSVSRPDKYMPLEEREMLQEQLNQDIDQIYLDKAEEIRRDMKQREMFLE